MKIKGIFENESLWIKFLFIILAPIVLGILFTFISNGVIAILGTTDEHTILKTHQLLAAIGMFILASTLLAYLFSQKPMEYLGLKTPYGMTIILTVLSMFTVLPLSNYITIACSDISLPQFLAPLEKILTEIESKSDGITTALLYGNSYGDLAINILILAIIPAFGEELLFRGLILNSLCKKKLNIHICIWITALLFSMIHIQFHKFIPIMLLGAYFGYLRIWSDSLWTPIAAHFTNNLAIVLYYFFLKGRTYGIDPENIGTSGSPIVIVSFAILFFVFVHAIWIICRKRLNEQEEDDTAPEETSEA